MSVPLYLLLWLGLCAYLAQSRVVKHWVSRTATGCLAVAWAWLTLNLFQRGLSARHWPLTNRYEYSLVFLWAVLTVYLLLEVSWRKRQAGAYVAGIALLIASYAITRPAAEQEIAPLLPVLRTMWLPVHGFSAALGYGSLAVAAGLAVMRLVLPPASEDNPDERQPTTKVPGRAEVERMLERLLAAGFPWLTFSILAGGIWAQNAWGRYWGWDPKEIWSLIVWLGYLLLFHLRGLRRWRGGRLAVLVVLVFCLVLFNFVGVPWLVRTVRLESLHGF